MTDGHGVSPPQVSAWGQQGIAIGGHVIGSLVATGPVHVHWTAATAPTRPEFKRYLRMLAVVAAPVVGLTVNDPPPAPLDLWGEWQRLEQAIRSAWDWVKGQGAPWAVVRLNPPTRHALADALAAGAPDTAYQVVHVSGHGSPDGLALEDEWGRTDFVTGDELVALFRSRPVRLVVLNACQSEPIARRLRGEAGVPAVIAMTDTLFDDEASLLTARLYTWLARGRSVAEAFAEVRSALRYAYEHGELSIPRDQAAAPAAYVAQRLAVPVLLGDARLELPPEEERAAEPLVTLAEPPSRGVELGLVEGFVGRGAELVQVARWLRERPSPVIVLSGLGGIGKSALAAMATLRGSYRFRAVVSLSARNDPHVSPDDLVPPLDGALGKDGALASAPTREERLARAIEALNQTPTLLVLENLEDLAAPAARAWAEFLGRLDPRQGSVAILTLRPAVKHPLTDLAGPAHRSLERLGEPDAVRLLADGLLARHRWDKVPYVRELTLAQQQRLQDLARRAYLTRLSVGQLAALDELAERTGRHPLALKLALGDLEHPHVTWAKALANVSDLRGRDWEAQAEAMIGRMVADLAQADPEAVALLQALLAFQRGATYEALRAVAAPGTGEVAFDDRLRAALDSSLLEARGSGEAARYDLHPLTHAYLKRQRPPAPATLAELRRRHAGYFVGWACRHRQDFDALEVELPNLRAGFAFVTSEATRDEAMVHNYGSALFDMFQTRCYWDDVLAWMGEAARACEALHNRAALARVHNSIGLIHNARGEYEAALAMFQQAAPVLEEIGDRATLATVHNNIGEICRARGEYGTALAMLQQAMLVLEEIGDRATLARVYNNIGGTHHARGEYEAALAMYQKAALVLEEIGDWATLARVCNNIGGIHHDRGEYEAALAMLQKAAPVLEEIGDRAMLATVHHNIGRVYHARGEYMMALKMYQKAAPVLEEIGDRTTLAKVHNSIGRVYGARGDHKAALAIYQRAVPILEEIGDRATLAEVHNNIGEVYRAHGEYEVALAMYRKAALVLEEIGDRATLTKVYNNIGLIHSAQGEYEAALAMFQQAAPVLEEIGDRATLATVHNNIGEVYRVRGDYEAALVTYQKAALVLEEIGDRAMLAKVHNNIGTIHHARGEYEAALTMYQKAAPVLEEIGDRAMLATVHNNIGEVYRAHGEYEVALAMFQQAAPVLEEIGDRTTLATLEENLGMLYLQLDEVVQAEAHLRRSVALFDELGLETDSAQTTRQVLQMGLSQGWSAVRQLLLPLLAARRAAPGPLGPSSVGPR